MDLFKISHIYDHLNTLCFMHVTVYTVFNVILLSVKDVYIQAHKYGGWMQGVHTPALLVKSVHINADCPGFQENVPFFSDFRHWTPALKKSYLRACDWFLILVYPI